MGHIFSERLREMRKARGMNQRDVEEALSLRPGTVSQYERGLREPGFDLLVAVADLFDTTADYMLGRPEAPGESYALLVSRERLHRSLEALPAGPLDLARLLALAEQAGPNALTLPRLARRIGVPAAMLRLCRDGLAVLPAPAQARLLTHLGLPPDTLKTHTRTVDSLPRFSHG